ncbi:kinase-like protein [Zopfia rhizophila CBS 207.26]|uniref:non-specific serine/threonine protein kinase n=1 Tax=Zopfia rhizophila CBS 207.26 TaxID=1314779 RepID=A0A6A6DC96_9PEZI|nr:kinase-like protein [Zopfia rhizophila CBS 207.26]
MNIASPPLTLTERAADANLVGNGSFGYVWRIARDRVLKEPKIYSNNNSGSAYSNMVNRAEILNEKAVYERLGTHHGIIHCFKALDESIELAFANQGDLSTYMRANPLPSQKFRVKWIQVVVNAFSHAHARRVVIQDISLRNILVHENSLKLSDFGESSLLPLDTDMTRFCVNDTTPQIEILHLGCILYSIAAWKEFKYNYFEAERWPEVGELPVTDDILYASIIKKCWNGEYVSMEALLKDVQGMGDE